MAQVLGYPFEKTAIVTQTFAEHVERAKAHGWCWQPGPCPSGIYYFGGIDFGVVVGTQVFAVMDGQVAAAGVDTSGYGIHVRVQYGDYLVVYAHLSKAMVKVNQSVRMGDLIGWSGNTGNSEGAHLHLELREKGVPIDPWPGLLHQPSPNDEPIFAGSIPATGKLPMGETIYTMNLRDGPSTKYPICGWVPMGVKLAFQRFEVESRDYLWGCIGGYPNQWMAICAYETWMVKLEGTD